MLFANIINYLKNTMFVAVQQAEQAGQVNKVVHWDTIYCTL